MERAYDGDTKSSTENYMNPSLILTVASLISIILMTLHLTDDIVRGIEPGTLTNLIAIPILLVWLYGTMVLRGQRSGYVIMLLGGLFALLMPFIHMRGAGVGGEFAKSAGSFFFIWTILTLGLTGSFSVVLSTVLWIRNWRESINTK
jgi:hypothetical protein